MPELAPQTLQILHTLPALRGLGPADRERVAGLFREVSAANGEVLFREGDPGDALYVVAAGGVRVVSGGREVTQLGPGEWFGEMALLSGEPRSAGVEAVVESRLLCLPADRFARLLELQPRLYAELAAILSRRLAARTRADPRAACRVVVIEPAGRWRGRRALIEGLAAALEHELERSVAILTLATAAAAQRLTPRPGSPDAVLVTRRRGEGAWRSELAARLGELASRVPLVLLDVHEAPGGAERWTAPGADAVTLRLSGPPAERPGARGRVVSLWDRRHGPPLVPPGEDAVVLPEREPRRSRALERLARMLTGRSVGVALGSGAAYGLAHIGVLEVFDEAGIPVDYVAGASMGAIVAAHYAYGMRPARMRELAVQLADRSRVLRLLPKLLPLALDFNLVRPGLFSGKRFLEALESLAPLRGCSFADLEIPFRAVATDLDTGARVEIGEGTLGDALRASFSAPWVLSPHPLGGRVLIDGGMCDPVPSETVRSMGADRVIAVNVVPPPDPAAKNPLERLLGAASRFDPLARFRVEAPVPGSFDVVLKTLQIMQHELGNARAGEADCLITPDLSRYWALEFWSAPGLIESGARAAAAGLPAIQKRLAERRPVGR